MKLRIAKTLLMMLMIAACNEEDEPSRVVLATVTVSPDHFYPGQKLLIIATDEEGLVLDAQEIENGSVVELTSERHVELMTITLANRENYNGTYIYFLQTYAGVTEGYEIKYSIGPPEGTSQPVADGQSHFSITNFPFASQPHLYLTVSSPWGIDGGMTNASYEAGTYEFDLDNTAGEQHVLIAGYHDEVPVYYDLHDVRKNDLREIDYEDFQPFELTIQPEFAFGITNGEIYGFDAAANAWYLFTSTSQKEATSATPLLGYLPGYDIYHFSYSNQNGKQSSGYYSNGPEVNYQEVPEFSVVVENESVREFKSSISVEVNYRMATFLRGSGMDIEGLWFVYSKPDDVVQLSGIEQTINEAYPGFRLDDFAYSNVSWHLWTDEVSQYERLLSYQLGGVAEPQVSAQLLFSQQK